ncbi:unnamed protein product [[Candida] boidinii]|nr:hypothetical protein BVG19_g2875 [[Candida] boidinii]OWB52749.1 hypothetical protein B5S27_g4330 [[Candida] boidinii]GME86384.1 unnamed protein product [[Candida] boidinii]
MDVQLTEDQLLRGDLEERKRSRKKTINVNDYSSDSDEDEDEAVKDYELGLNGNNGNASKLKSGDDIDDDDMFASGSDDEVPAGADKESKQAVKKTTKDGIKLMDMDEFEKSLNSKEEDKLQTVKLSSNTGETAHLFDEKDTVSEIRDKYKDPDYRRQESEYYNNPEDFDIYVGDRLKFKKKEPKIESFDLKKEMKRGDFDESGNYILKKRGKNSEDESGEDDDDNDDDDYDDDDDIATNKSRSKEAWLLNVSQKDIEKAKQVERDRAERQKQKYILERSKLRDFPTEKILSDLIKLLQIAETPLEALQRLNEIVMKEKKNAKIQKRLYRNRKVTENNDWTGFQGDSDAIYAKSLFDITKQTINQISENCDMLTKRNFTKVYETSREELMRDYRRVFGKDFAVVDNEDTKSKRKYDKVASDGDASDVEEFSVTKESEPMEPIPADKGHIQWEYYWGEDPDTIYGPFTTDEMAAWSDSYFLEQEVFVRRVGTDDIFSNIRDVTL